MKAKRILSALLATLMLTASFTSCATEGDTNDSDSTQTESGSAEEKGPQDNLPADLTFNNVNLTIHPCSTSTRSFVPWCETAATIPCPASRPKPR